MPNSTLTAVRNKVEEVKATYTGDDIVQEDVHQSLDEIISFIDSLTLDDKIDCCRA